MSAPNRGNGFEESVDNDHYRDDVDGLEWAIHESKKQRSGTHNAMNMPMQASPQKQLVKQPMDFHTQIEMGKQAAVKLDKFEKSRAQEMYPDTKAALAASMDRQYNPRASGGSNDSQIKSQIKKDAEVALQTAGAEYDEICILAHIKDLYENSEFWCQNVSMPQMKMLMADGMNVREATCEAARAAARVASRGGGSGGSGGGGGGGGAAAGGKK